MTPLCQRLGEPWENISEQQTYNLPSDGAYTPTDKKGSGQV